VISDFEHFLDRIPPWGRWLLFLPGAVIAALLGLLMWQVFYFFMRLLPILSLFYWFVSPLFNAVAFQSVTMIFIATGAQIAPSGRRLVAVLLALVPFIVLLGNAYIRVRGFVDPQLPLWELILDSIFVLVGILLGLATVFKADAETMAE
jgi:hypothetical protein